MALHYLLAGGFAFVALRGLGLGWPGAALGTVTWAFSPPNLESHYHPVRLACLTWVPLVLLAFVRLLERPGRRAAAALAGAAALTLLGGYPEYARDTGRCLLVFWLVAGWRVGPGGGRAPGGDPGARGAGSGARADGRGRAALAGAGGCDLPRLGGRRHRALVAVARARARAPGRRAGERGLAHAGSPRAGGVGHLGAVGVEPGLVHPAVAASLRAQGVAVPAGAAAGDRVRGGARSPLWSRAGARPGARAHLGRGGDQRARRTGAGLPGVDRAGTDAAPARRAGPRPGAQPPSRLGAGWGPRAVARPAERRLRARARGRAARRRAARARAGGRARRRRALPPRAPAAARLPRPPRARGAGRRHRLAGARAPRLRSRAGGAPRGGRSAGARRRERDGAGGCGRARRARTRRLDLVARAPRGRAELVPRLARARGRAGGAGVSRRLRGDGGPDRGGRASRRPLLRLARRARRRGALGAGDPGDGQAARPRGDVGARHARARGGGGRGRGPRRRGHGLLARRISPPRGPGEERLERARPRDVLLPEVRLRRGGARARPRAALEPARVLRPPVPRHGAGGGPLPGEERALLALLPAARPARALRGPPGARRRARLRLGALARPPRRGGRGRRRAVGLQPLLPVLRLSPDSHHAPRLGAARLPRLRARARAADARGGGAGGRGDRAPGVRGLPRLHALPGRAPGARHRRRGRARWPRRARRRRRGGRQRRVRVRIRGTAGAAARRDGGRVEPREPDRGHAAGRISPEPDGRPARPLGPAREPLPVRGPGAGVRRRRARARAGAGALVPRGGAGAGAGGTLPRAAAGVPLAAGLVVPLAELRLLLRRDPGGARRRAEPPAGPGHARPPSRRARAGGGGGLLARAVRPAVGAARARPGGAGDREVAARGGGRVRGPPGGDGLRHRP